MLDPTDCGDTHIIIVSKSIPPALSGGGRRALRQARYWAARGRRVTIVTGTSRQESIPGVQVRTVNLAGWYTEGHSSLMKNARLLFYLWGAIGNAATNQPAVVYCMGGGTWFSLLPTLIAKVRRLKVVIEPTTMNSGDPLTLRKGKFGIAKLALFKFADAVVNLSPEAARRCKAAGISIEKQHLIPNSVDTDAFAPPSPEEKQRLREKLGIDAFRTILLSVGAIRHNKNAKALVRTFARVAETHSESALVLVGPLRKDAENVRYAAEVREMIETHKLTDRVLLPGAVENIPEWMKASDMFLFASRSEGFGTVVVEAMATGLPVVAMEIPNVTRFMLTDGEDGYVATSPGAFTQAVQEVLAFPERRVSLGRRARGTAEDRFSHEVVMTRYLDLFDQLWRSAP